MCILSSKNSQLNEGFDVFTWVLALGMSQSGIVIVYVVPIVDTWFLLAIVLVTFEVPSSVILVTNTLLPD